jgi:hypothetical protein
MPNNQLVLQADNGKYLSRIRRGTLDPIEAAKTQVDVFCMFTVTVLDNGKIALKADNGKYLSRIRRGTIDPIEAAKSKIDYFCQFRVFIME